VSKRKRFSVEEETGSLGNWRVVNTNTGNTTKTCRTRKEAREYARNRNAKLSR
jgi:hypothetical protein